MKLLSSTSSSSSLSSSPFHPPPSPPPPFSLLEWISFLLPFGHPLPPLLPPSLLSVTRAVPPPTITIGRVGEPYNGTTYSLTCTVTVDSSVDTGISISSQWSYSGDMTSSDIITNTTERQGLQQQTNLTFNPLRSQDDRTYACTVDIDSATLTAYVLGNSASEDVSISVKSKCHTGEIICGNSSPSQDCPSLMLSLLSSPVLGQEKRNVWDSTSLEIQTPFFVKWVWSTTWEPHPQSDG